MGLIRTSMVYIRNTIPFLRPLRELIIAFGITGYLIYRIPISEETRAKSKFLHPELGHKGH